MAADYDLVIIGTGAAGMSAAAAAVNEGASRVAVLERGPLWGTCVNHGCIPSKFLLSRIGVALSRSTFSQVMAEKQALIGRLREEKHDRFLVRSGIELIEGDARFFSPHELRTGTRRISAQRFIIATGSTPSIPPVVGLESVPYVTSTEALSPDHIPASIIILGGRSLGLEFAQIYAHMGTAVTLLQRSSRIIPEEEPEISDLMARYLAGDGITIITGTEVIRVDRSGERVNVTIAAEGRKRVIAAETLLLATGRSPDTRTLHAENAGVRTSESGAILVDATLRTTTPNIWAAGDVIGEPMLETAARYSGEIAAWNAFHELKRSYNPAFIPHGIFTIPQVASVGLTEDRAKGAGLHPITHGIMMDRLAKSAIDGEGRGMVKVVAEEESGRIIGVHICAVQATEMIQEGVLAVTRKLSADDLADTPHVFPTATEALSICARGLRRAAKKQCRI